MNDMRKKSRFLLIVWVVLLMVSACAPKVNMPPRPTHREKGCGCELVQPEKSLEEHA